MRAFLFTLLIIYLVWLWSSATRSKLKATAFCQASCQEVGVQFLDQTVALTKFGLGKSRSGTTRDGWLAWQRVYEFDFSTDGSNRHKGQVALQGNSITSLHLDHPEGPLIFTPGQKPVK